MNKLIISLILISSLLFAFAPAGFPPYVLELHDTMTYRVTNSVNGIYQLRYYAFGGSCSVAVYWWDTGWRYATGITIPEGGAWEENSWIPRMACIEGYKHVQVSSSDLASPKGLTFNPGWPRTFTHLLFGK